MGVIDVLKPHNLKAFQEIDKLINSGIKKIAVPRATGSGKTYLMGALAEKYNDNKKLVLEPTRPLLDGVKEKFEEFGIANTDFMTYQKLIRLNEEDIAAMDYKLIFLDECHHGTAPVWGQKINYLMETHSDSIIFGTSATTVRNDGVNVVESIFEGNAVCELSLSTAIARKVLPCPHYITAIYRLDDEFEKLKKRIAASTNTKEEKLEFYEKMKIMKSHFEKSYGIPTILNKYIKAKNGRYLVFCKNRKHLDTMRDVVIDWFRTAGIKDIHNYAVYSDYPDKEKDYKDFCEDNSDSCKVLFSINMLNEGLHIKNISGVLMLRTTQSNLIYLQQLGRLVDADNIDKYLLVFDFVNNFSSVNDGIGLLKEIKDAIAREKENDSDFDNSEFEDIDTFFVLENVIEIQDMFKEIEGRLEGSWDLYIKALKQYKEREGDCLVPPKHVESVDGKGVCLGRWCLKIRNENNTKRGNFLLNDEMKKQLDKEGFIWDANAYRFKANIMKIMDYCEKYGEFPKVSENSIGSFILKEKKAMQKPNYPTWKMNMIEKYIPEFSWDYNSEKMFKRFVYYANVYKERYGHIDIKFNDVIDGYNIGAKLNKFNSDKMSKDKIDKLIEMGIFIGNRLQNRFDKKLELAQKAVEHGVIIQKTNPNYSGENLYNWIITTVKRKYQNNDLTREQINIIEKLMNKSLDNLFRGNLAVPTKVVDTINDKEIGIFKTRQCVAKYIKEKYGFNLTNGIIDNRLTGKVITPYKGRFMFYYATDEEIKKYLDDNKAS